MRCAMLAFLPNYYDVCIMDCYITNPHPINIYANIIYCVILRYTAIGVTKSHIIHCVTQRREVFDTCQEVREVVLQAVGNREFNRDVKSVGKGWVLHALYCAIWGWYHFDTYQDPIDHIILKGGDTDTNAAIAGALIGANLGYNKLMLEERTRYNVGVVRQADFSKGENPRPIDMCLTDFDQLVATYATIVGDTIV